MIAQLDTRLYFIDAQDRSSECHRKCKRWSGEGKMKASKSKSTKKGSASTLRYKCRSPFVGVLFQRLRTIVNQPYHLTLVVTAVLTTLLEYVACAGRSLYARVSITVVGGHCCPRICTHQGRVCSAVYVQPGTGQQQLLVTRNRERDYSQ